MKATIQYNKIKREINGPFSICLREGDLRNMVEIMQKAFDQEGGFHYGWIEFVSKPESAANTASISWNDPASASKPGESQAFKIEDGDNKGEDVIKIEYNIRWFTKEECNKEFLSLNLNDFIYWGKYNEIPKNNVLFEHPQLIGGKPPFGGKDYCVVWEINKKP